LAAQRDWPRLVVPAYFHPDARPRDWAWLAEHPKEVRLVILNVASGPGTAPEPAFRAAVDRLHAAGVGVIGYADTDYGDRRQVDVLADLGQYQDWYGVEGLCLDRVASSADKLPWFSALTARLRAAGARTLFFNHGTHPDAGYAQLAELLGTFEGPWHAYRRLEIPRWTTAFPPEKFYHVVYSVPPGRFDDAVRLALRRRAAAVYVTWRYGDNPYDRLPVDDRK
jgi:Spherulation-specific family 4